MSLTVSNQTVLICREGIFYLEGQVNFDTVVPLYQQGLVLFESKPKIIVDLQGLEHQDSSVLALLSGWLRVCRQQAKSIQFQALPNSLIRLLRLSGLEKVFPIEPPIENGVKNGENDH